ncbi:MAG: efflux RND transporter periplasmic adaptor subunit [Nitrospirae bacterium]|nr:efflux RND transporter periplasmic adaptor subunit [Nitrospirota bacterium]
MSSRLKKSIVMIVAALAVVAAVAAYRATRVIEVATAPVARGEMVLTVTPTETGTVETEDTALVKAEIGEPVTEVAVREGDVVKAGAILVRLAPTSLQARLTLARSSLAAARARLDSARIALHLEQGRTDAALKEAQARFDSVKQRYDKKRQLAQSGLISADEMETLEAELASTAAGLETAKVNREQVGLQQRQITAAEAEVAQQEASVRVAELDLDHTVIRSPIDGTVMEAPVKPGELVLPGTPVARITRRGDLHIKALIDEVDLARVHLGQPARITFDLLPGRTFEGTVSEISPAVSVERLKSRTVPVKIRLARPLPELQPGLSADVEIVVETLPDVLYVPTEAVMSKDKEQFVYVVDRGVVAKRPVQTGRSSWDATEIRSGVARGEAVITSLDLEALKPGVRVKPR